MECSAGILPASVVARKRRARRPPDSRRDAGATWKPKLHRFATCYQVLGTADSTARL